MFLQNSSWQMVVKRYDVLSQTKLVLFSKSRTPSYKALTHEKLRKCNSAAMNGLRGYLGSLFLVLSTLYIYREIVYIKFVYAFPLLLAELLGGVTGRPDWKPPYGNFFLSAGFNICKNKANNVYLQHRSKPTKRRIVEV